MELAEALRRPGAYPFAVDAIGFRQTHISWVFLAGPYAYKVKKPVNLGFLDYTTLERRRVYCEEEVRLNRRLAPDLYLGVVPISGPPDQPGVESSGPAIDYAVKMRRLPEERTLDRLLGAGGVHDDDIERLAQHRARFHDEADAGPHVDRYGSLDVVQQNWQENFDQVQPYAGRTISTDELERCRGFVDEHLARPEVFEARVRDRRIRDCHGDLRAESVWMGEDGRFEVFDCIEFNERLRRGDVASEVAFLATDLDWRGRPDLAWLWTDAYRRASGDEAMAELFPFISATGRLFAARSIAWPWTSLASASRSARRTAAARVSTSGRPSCTPRGSRRHLSLCAAR
jgi:aminoglycoside phosphotransferase family enzyme